MKKLLSILSLSALLLASCSKSSSPTSTNNNNNNNNNTNPNKVVATVGGSTITFNTLGTAGNATTYINGIAVFAIAGRDSASQKTMTIGGGGSVSAGQSYDIGTKSATQYYNFGLTYSMVDASGNTIYYGTTSSSNTKVGTIYISSISSSNVQGTFSATLPQTNPSDPTKTVSVNNGSFNVNF